MSMLKEFRDFAIKGNALQLAVAVVIGTAFTKIVTAVVDDLLMPLMNAVLPGGAWREYTVTPLEFRVGHLLGAVVDFLLVALVLFLVVVKLLERFSRKEPAPAPTTRACPECLELVPLAARRCRACTAPLPTV